jgi:GDPmannose 4,6-dehydratase
VGIDDWSGYVTEAPELSRRDDVDMIVGDASKARAELGWSPSVSFEELVRMMVQTDLEAEQGAAA